MIDFLHVTKLYKAGSGVRQVDCQIRRGEVVVIEGATGSGKSTILRMLAGLERPDSGRIVVAGTSLYDLSRRELTAYRRQLGWVSNEIGLLSDRSLLENVALPLYLRGTLSKKAIKHRALDALSAVGLTGRAGFRSKEFSPGETIRACLARALANEPALLLVDEPINDLDPESRQVIIDAIREEKQQEITVIIASTNGEPYSSLASRKLNISEGRLVEDVPAMTPPLASSTGLWTGLRP